MPRSSLHTLDRRSIFSQRRRRRRAIAASVVAACLVLGAGGIAFALVKARRQAPVHQASTASVTTATAETTPAPSATSTVAATPTPEPSAPPPITIAAVGDLMFDRNVRVLIGKQGGAAPLARVASTLSAADVTVGNLESMISKEGTPVPDKDPTLHGDPRAIEGLTAAGFDALSLANNHVLDFGAPALLDTVAKLDRAGIAHAGAGANQSAAWTAASFERGGARVAYLAFSHIVPPGFIAQPSRAGLASGRTDLARVTSAISEAKKTHDYVLVSFHWGIEYVDDANAEQVKVAHAAIDAGADLVLAHHPHVIQAVERYRRGLIAYSLGDFVFDHYSVKTGEAFILGAELGPNGVANATATPVYLDSYGRPEVVTGTHATSILTRLKAISAKRMTTVTLSGDIARIQP